MIRLFAATLAAVALTVPIRAMAGSRNMRDETRISVCIRKASLGHGWLEKTLWGLRDQEAGWIGAEIRNSNGSYDLGPLQINSWWVPRIAARVGQSEIKVRYWLRFDPCFNAEAARWIFLSGLRSARGYWEAIGAYHSPSPPRQNAYTVSVARRLTTRFGKQIFVEKTEVEKSITVSGTGR